MSTIRGIEGGDANKTMDPGLALEVTVCIRTTGNKRDALDAGFFTVLNVDNAGFIVLPFRPTQVHSKEHLGPVLGLSSPCTGIDRDNGIFGIVFAA